MRITKEKSIQYAEHPTKFVLWFGIYGLMPFINDKTYTKLQFKTVMGYPVNLDHLRTFNEKLAWLKFYDRNSEYTIMANKYAAKKWVKDRIGEEYIVPILGIWDYFDEIDFKKLPDRFVLKCTHDSDSVVIVCDKEKLDKVVTKKKLGHALRYNWNNLAREWEYKNISPRIIAEKYMMDEILAWFNQESLPFEMGNWIKLSRGCRVIDDRIIHLNEPREVFISVKKEAA